MTEEWSHWIEHVPGTCPITAGEWIEVEYVKNGKCYYASGRVDADGTRHPSWRITDFHHRKFVRITRYRIRTPSGLVALRRLLETSA